MPLGFRPGVFGQLALLLLILANKIGGQLDVRRHSTAAAVEEEEAEDDRGGDGEEVEVGGGDGVDPFDEVSDEGAICCHFSCLVWFGLVWFGLVWFGLVWFEHNTLTWLSVLRRGKLTRSRVQKIRSVKCEVPLIETVAPRSTIQA